MTHGRPSSARSGQSMIEVIVAMAVFVFFAAAFAKLTLGAPVTQLQARSESAAAPLAAEGLEAARSIARRGFGNLTDGAHGIDQRTNVFVFSGSSDTVGIYHRQVTVSPITRTALGAVASGGTIDPYAKSVISAVTWTGQAGQTLTASLTSEITDFLHLRWLVDLVADFTPGSRQGTVVTSRSDGEVQLDGLGDLKTEQHVFDAVIPGGADIRHIAFDRQSDRLYASTLNNAGGGEFFAFDISNVSTQAPTILGSVEFGVPSYSFAIGTNYAYVLTDDSAREIRVVRLSDLAVVATWNLPSTGFPNDIVLDEANGRAYVGVDTNSGREFFVISIANPLAPAISVISQVEMGTNIDRIVVSNGFAYTITSATNGELKIVNLSTLAISTCNLPGSQIPAALVGNGNTLYIGRDFGAVNEFIAYSINPAAPSDCAYILAHIVGQTGFGGGVWDMALDTDHNLMFAVVIQDPNEFQVIDLSTFTATQADPAGTDCDAIAFLGKFAYLGCRLDSAGLQVWRGNGSAGLPTFGTYTSPAYDSTKAAPVWGQLQRTKSGTGTVTLRLRTASTQAGLVNAAWVGSDGTHATVYNQNGLQNVTTDPGATGTRWIQWKAILTGSGTATPSLEDVLLYYK